jgi:hypothetical protein
VAFDCLIYWVADVEANHRCGFVADGLHISARKVQLTL